MDKEKVIKKSDAVNDRGGFFKFEEELKNICLSNTITAGSSVQIQKDVIIKTCEGINNSNEENLGANYSNFFNDSDFDSIIMQCNEDKDPVPVTTDLSNNSSLASFSRVTSLPTNTVMDRPQHFQRTVTMPTKSVTCNSLVTSPSILQKDENYLQAFFDDSEEFDDILMQCSQKVEEELKQSQNSTQSAVSNQFKARNDKSFLRHSSMPGSPSINTKVDKGLVSTLTNNQNKSFQRTISMPTRGLFKASSNSISSCGCKFIFLIYFKKQN